MENGNLKHQQKEKIKSLEVAMRQIIQDKNIEIDIMRRAMENLNDKCSSLIVENSAKTSLSTSDLLKIINEKNTEISALRKELVETSRRYNSRLLQEDANKQAIDGLLTKYSVEVQQERDRYLSEMRRLNDAMEILVKENSNLKYEIQSLDNSYRQRVDEINLFTKLHNEDLKKNESILMEYNNKESSVYEKINAQERRINDLGIVIATYEIKFNEQEAKIRDLEGKQKEYDARVGELRELEIKYLNEANVNKETYDQMIRTLSDTVTTQCDDIYNLMQVNEKYEALLKEKEREFEHLKEEFIKKEYEIVQEYEILQRKAILNPKDLELKFEAERTSYRTEISQFKRVLQDYEGRLNKTLEEKDWLRKEITEKQKELGEIKKNSSGKVSKEEFEKLKTMVETFKKENFELKERNLRINGEKNELESHLKRLVSENENSHRELIEAFEIIENIKDNNQNNKEISGMNLKINALMQRNKKLEEEVSGSKEKAERLEQENGKFRSEIYILKEKLSKKDEEHRQKTMEFNQKINDLNELHKKYDNAINTFESENRISILKKSIVRKDYK